MQITEAEAKTKWCPFARVANFEGSYNRFGASLKDKADAGLGELADNRCVGSDCMAWRAEEPAAPDEHIGGPMLDMASFVRRRLQELDKTATAASVEVGLPAGFITDLISGRKGNVQARNLQLLAKALGCEATELMARPAVCKAPAERRGYCGLAGQP